ncbi:hypothetical protein YC2023_085082 [Brassica napus]
MLMIVLPYLHSVFVFISLSGVSPVLRNSIRDQTVLWTMVVVEPPLSSYLTDDNLWEFTLKSAGKLNTLIRRVVDANPLIKKLIVPGCTGLVPEGIIACGESLAKNNHKLETLHINGVPGFTKDHLSALLTYLPQEGAIDLEVCPKCDQVRMIPPCSRESCVSGMKVLNVREGTNGRAGDAGIASLDAWNVQSVSDQTLIRLKKQRVGQTLCVFLVAKRFQSAGSATNHIAQQQPEAR